MKKGNRYSKNNTVEVLDIEDGGKVVLGIDDVGEIIKSIQTNCKLRGDGVSGINSAGNIIIPLIDTVKGISFIITIYIKRRYFDVDIFWKSATSIGRSNIESYTSLSALTTGVIVSILGRDTSVSGVGAPSFTSSIT